MFLGPLSSAVMLMLEHETHGSVEKAYMDPEIPVYHVFVFIYY
jgi:hypothetical protein